MPIHTSAGALDASPVPVGRDARARAKGTRVEQSSSIRKDAARASPPDYSLWSLEELRAFAAQMRLPKAAAMSRSELLEIFAPPARSSVV